jgi:parallel beta-helix repeat protein
MRGIRRKSSVAVAIAGLLLLSTASAFIVSASSGTLTITTSTTLAEDHVGNIIIAADDVTLDCAGHTVSGPGTGPGVLLDGRSGVTVQNCQVTGFEEGILILAEAGRSAQNTLAANELFDNVAGVHVIGSSSDVISHNVARDNALWGYSVERSTGELLSRNEATRNQLRGFELRGSSDNRLEYNTAAHNGLLGGGTGIFVTDGRAPTRSNTTSPARTTTRARTASASSPTPMTTSFGRTSPTATRRGASSWSTRRATC